MPNAIENYVDAHPRAHAYTQAVKDATDSLADLEMLTALIEEKRLEIQVSSEYTAQVKTAANEMAVTIRDAIVAFAAAL